MCLSMAMCVYTCHTAVLSLNFACRPGLKPPISRIVVRAAPVALAAKTAAAGEPPAKRQRAAADAGEAAEPSGGTDSDEGGGLAGLLGDYGSDSDGEDAEAVSAPGDGPQNAAEPGAGPPQTGGSPPAPPAAAGPAHVAQDDPFAEEQEEELLDYE